MTEYPEIQLSLHQKGLTYNQYGKPKITMDLDMAYWMLSEIGKGTTDPGVFHRDPDIKWCLTTKREKILDKNFKQGYIYRATAYRLIVKPGLDASLILFKLTWGER